MATLLKSLLGNGGDDRALTEEMRTIVRELRAERGLCEALVKSARASLTHAQEIGGPMAKAADEMDAALARMAALQQRVTGFEQLATQYQTLDESAERLRQSQRQAEARMAHAAEEARRIQSGYEELHHKLDVALDLRDRIESFLALESPFNQLSTDAEALRRKMSDASEQLGRLHEQQDRMMDAHRAAFTRMETFERRQEELGRAVQDKERRVASVEQAARALEGMREAIEETARRVDTVKALGDYVTQKSSALEAQREVVERAVSRADHLDQAMREIGVGMRQQQENARTLGAIQEKIAGLQSLYEVVVQRSHEIQDMQRAQEEEMDRLRTQMSAAGEQAQKTVERLEFESRGLESVSQRVADLRSALADFEARFSGLAESRQKVEVLQSDAQLLASKLAQFAAHMEQLDAEAEQVQSIRRDLDNVATSAREATAAVARIEEARPAVEATVRDVEGLRGAQALVKDALEQTQLAAAELARTRGDQTETRSWIAEVKRALTELDEHVAELRTMTPTVEFVQKQVQRVNESMVAIESRREFAEELHRRMAELGALGATIDERGRDLQSRMDAAEQRFVAVAAHANEAERLDKSIAGVSGAVEVAERNVAQLGRDVAALETRCESVESIAERTRALRQELEQREHALEEATKDLQRASELRGEAAAAAQELDERAKRLTAAVGNADRQVERIDSVASQLEDRAASLQFVERRLGAFEDRLAKWELVEQEVARSLEQLNARQGTVEALQADVDRMFATAEKTAADIRAVTSAEREIADSRALLESVLGQLRQLQETASALDERKRQMAQAESRLGRVEALLHDVRSSLSTLQGQKVIIDQAVEKAGSLEFLLKQAESMIEALRDERDVTTRVRAAMNAALQTDEPGGDMAIAG